MRLEKIAYCLLFRNCTAGKINTFSDVYQISWFWLNQVHLSQKGQYIYTRAHTHTPTPHVRAHMRDIIVACCYSHHHCVQDIWICMSLVIQFEIMTLFIWGKGFYRWIELSVITLFTASTLQFCQNPLSDVYFCNMWKAVICFPWNSDVMQNFCIQIGNHYIIFSLQS